MNAEQKRRVFGLIAIAGAAAGTGTLVFLMLFGRLEQARFESRLESFRGRSPAYVRVQLGAPSREWFAGAFTCDEDFPCNVAPRGGGVTLYRQGNVAWYLAFDSAVGMVEFERSEARR